ncbi:hypothetical protein [Bacillus sp. 37MA]|uniref:hypothetical protein n=1 Tax=Bacillus sp. 37MA TaxID=1132442 RepID=UPI00035C8550|nr:hypothetical protein [Bacillus sp. 37MA]
MLRKLGMRGRMIVGLIVILGVVLGLKFMGVLPIAADFDQSGKSVSKEQQDSYNLAVEVAEMVKESREVLIKEMNKMKEGKGDTEQYKMLMENVNQYERMYTEIQAEHNCKYFDICTDTQDTTASLAPLPASGDILGSNREIQETDQLKP